MNRLPIEKRAQIINMLVEGSSMRAASRIADVSINTVTKLLVDVGNACFEYQDANLRNLSCKRVQCDEIWSFCYSKAKNVPEAHKDEFGFGDIWTWTAIDAETKLVPCWHVGERDAASAQEFMDDLAGRLASRVQLTTDGFKCYLDAVDTAFGNEIDYAMLVKVYGESAREDRRRYSQSEFKAATKTPIVGKPEKAHVSTSYVERQNLTMRMHMRRFTRLTNGFSKKVENHMHAISLHFMFYNFCRIHKTLRVTPAMAAGVTDHVWSLEEVCNLAP